MVEHLTTNPMIKGSNPGTDQHQRFYDVVAELGRKVGQTALGEMSLESKA